MFGEKGGAVGVDGEKSVGTFGEFLKRKDALEENGKTTKSAENTQHSCLANSQLHGIITALNVFRFQWRKNIGKLRKAGFGEVVFDAIAFPRPFSPNNKKAPNGRKTGKRMVEPRGFEPLTFSLRTRRSTN